MGEEEASLEHEAHEAHEACASPETRAHPAMRLPFVDLKDSPIFQERLDELVALRVRQDEDVGVLVETARAYAGALDAACVAQVAFLDRVERFCERGGGRGGDSVEVLLRRCVGSMREMASFMALLGTQVEVIMCEGMATASSSSVAAAAVVPPLGQLVKEAKAAREVYEGARAKYQRRASKYSGAGEKALVADTVEFEKLERRRLEMVARREEHDVARLALARRLVESGDGRAEAEVLAGVASVLEAQRKYFEHGSGVASSSGARELVESCLEVGVGAREGLGGRLALFDGMALAVRRGGEHEAGAGVGVADVPRLIQSTMRSGGSTVTILKQGFLLKRSSKGRKWDRRYFVLDSSGVLYYYSEKAERGGLMPQQNTVNLVTAAVKVGLEGDVGVGNASAATAAATSFRIVSPEREYALQAEDAAEAASWVDVVQRVISCLLAGAYEADDFPRYMREAACFKKGASPMKPTHSRDASHDLSGAMVGMELGADIGGDDKRQAHTAEVGGYVCVDCGSRPADWASINLVARWVLTSIRVRSCA